MRGDLSVQAVLKELARMRTDGTHIGVSISGPAQVHILRKAMEITLDGSRLFETVQALEFT